MIWSKCWSTPGRVAYTLTQFFGGAVLFGIGLYKCHENAAPLREEIRQRDEIVMARLRLKYGPPPED